MKLTGLSLVLPFLAACSTSPAKPAGAIAPSTFVVDTTLQPSVATIPGLDGGDPRPVTTLTDSSGLTADFVQNELLVVTDSPSALDAFVARWQGKVVQSINPADAGLTGIMPLHLVQVNASAADTAGLAATVQQLNPAARGDFRFADQAGLELLAAAAQENAGALMVAMNFVPRGSSLKNGHPTEAVSGDQLAYGDANGSSSEAYSPDVSSWSYMRQGGDQDIGVVAAWEALAATNKLGNKVTLAVFDGGLLDSKDVPPGAIWISPPGSPNPSQCQGPSGGFDCPWHGTGTISAAMGVADNQFGAAGPAGPVALPILVPSPHDVWSTVKFLLVDIPVVAVLHPRIINFSFSVRIPEGINWVINPPLDLLFTVVRQTWGTLVFAAAGNEAKDVDETDSAGAFKVATWIPCQISNVICVGALALGKSTRAFDYTNWANTSEHVSHANTVDIYGPGTLWVPKLLGNTVLDEAAGDTGTSVASPFVAGVAALIWAADPTLSADEVEHILISTAHTGSADGLVNRWVNAFGAVKKALGLADIPPTIDISSEPDLFDPRSVTLRAVVADTEDGSSCCEVAWSSDVDGPLGSGLSLPHTFASAGTRIVTAVATDSQGVTNHASLSVTTTATAPTVNISSPDTSQPIYPGLSYALTGTALETSGDLCPSSSGATRLWSSSNAGDTIGNSGVCSTSIKFGSTGVRQLTFTVSDAYAATGHATLDVTVAPAPSLAVSIGYPSAGTSFNYNDVLTLEGDAIGTKPFSHRWVWRVQGCSDYVVPTTLPSVFPVPTPTFYELWDTSGGGFCRGDGVLWLEVGDAAAQSSSAQVGINFFVSPA
jgi:serine protease